MAGSAVVPVTRKLMSNSHPVPAVLGFLLTTLVVYVFYYLSGDSRSRLVVKRDESRTRNHSLPFPGCNLFSGKWVYDDESYPLYKEQQCSFLVDDFACGKFGRKEFEYQHWRWQPYDCDLPRFLSLSFSASVAYLTVCVLGKLYLTNHLCYEGSMRRHCWRS